MLTPVLVLFLASALAPLLHRALGRRAGVLLAAAPALLFAYFARFLAPSASGQALEESWPWVAGLGIRLAFRLDGLSLLFALLVTGIGALVLVYGGGYLKGDPRLPRFYSAILFFMAAMLGLVLADDAIALFVFWELTSVSSYLLIGFDHEQEKARKAALQALFVTGGGGLALLAGLLLLGEVAGTLQLSALGAQAGAIQAHALYLPALLLVLLGAFTKSAQFPFHFWLPGAMAAPSPVSAYLHSATMVKAGIYLLARLNPALGGTDAWHYLVILAGTATLVTGAVLAYGQTDLKRLLAFTTLSALGTLTVLVGISTELSARAAMVFLLVHALYKAALFLGVGAIDHEAGTRDVRLLGGLARAMPLTAFAVVASALSMAGLPPSSASWRRSSSTRRSRRRRGRATSWWSPASSAARSSRRRPGSSPGGPSSAGTAGRRSTPTRRPPRCGSGRCSSPASASCSAFSPTSSRSRSSSPPRARCAASTRRSCSAPGPG